MKLNTVYRREKHPNEEVNKIQFHRRHRRRIILSSAHVLAENLRCDRSTVNQDNRLFISKYFDLNLTTRKTNRFMCHAHIQFNLYQFLTDCTPHTHTDTSTHTTYYTMPFHQPIAQTRIVFIAFASTIECDG